MFRQGREKTSRDVRTVDVVGVALKRRSVLFGFRSSWQFAISHSIDQGNAHGPPNKTMILDL